MERSRCPGLGKGGGVRVRRRTTTTRGCEGEGEDDEGMARSVRRIGRSDSEERVRLRAQSPDCPMWWRSCLVFFCLLGISCVGNPLVAWVARIY